MLCIGSSRIVSSAEPLTGASLWISQPCPMRIGGSAIILVPRSGIDALLAGVRQRILLCLFPIGPDPREANPATDENADTVSKHDPIANAITATFEESQGIARPPLRIRIQNLRIRISFISAWTVTNVESTLDSWRCFNED